MAKRLDQPRRSAFPARGGDRLVLIACSQAKRKSPRSPIAACERYDGPFYKIIRKARREGRLNPRVRFAIVSAKYGLIDDQTPITAYDQRLTPIIAGVLGPRIRSRLQELIRAHSFAEVVVNLGRDYAAVVRMMPELRHAIWAEGSIGKRAAMLKQWICG